MGHLYRVVELARELTTRGAAVSLWVRGDESVPAFLQTHALAFSIIPESVPRFGEARWLHEAAGALSGAVVLDVGHTEYEWIDEYREVFGPVVTLDDQGPGSALADVVINMLIGASPHARCTRTGLEFLIVRAALLRARRDVEASLPERAQSILISIGGADVANLSIRTVAALARIPWQLDVVVVRGPSFGEPEALDAAAAASPHTIRVVPAPDDQMFCRLLSTADQGITSGGMTACEFAAVGVPTIAICQTPEELAENSFLRTGIVQLAGYGVELGDEDLARNILALATDVDARRRFKYAGLSAIDGRGTSRVAEVIMQLASSQSSNSVRR